MNFPIFKNSILALVVVFVFACCKSQTVVQPEKQLSFSYQLQPIDARFDTHPDSATTAILNNYKPQMDALMNVVIGESEEEIAAPKNWQSPICFFTTNALLEIANTLHLQADFSLYNIGGIRAGMPKGDIRLYDIYAVFPFDNDIVVITIQGKYIRELMEMFAKKNPQLMANVAIVFSQNRLKSMRINDEELNDEKMYRVVTNNFVAEGGDNMEVLLNAVSAEQTGIIIRDAITDYIKTLTDEGKTIRAKESSNIHYE